MSAFRFSVGQQFQWGSEVYEVKRQLPENQVQLEDIFHGSPRVEEIKALVDALFAGELQFLTPQQSAKHRSESPASTKTAHLDLSDYSEWQVAVARFRLMVIKPLIDLPPSHRTSAVIQNRINEVQATFTPPAKLPRKLLTLSRRSIFRWLHAYQQSGGDLRALIPAYSHSGAPGDSRLKPEVRNLIDRVITDNYCQREEVTLDSLVTLVAAQMEQENQLRPPLERLKLPARSTFARRLDHFDLQRRLEAKLGTRAAKRRLKQTGQTPYPQLPLERVEIDHTRIDLIVVDEGDNLPLGRPTLSYCLDTATRFPLGYYLGFEPASYYTVMECLYHAICPKDNVREKYGTEHEWIACGMPGLLVTDNGPEFIGQDLTDACEALGSALLQCPIETPEFKAAVERKFGTLNSGLFHTLPGTTFSNVIQRGDYDSVQQAIFSLGEIEQALNVFIVDIYAERFHTGLKGIPARRWERAQQTVFYPRLPADRDDLRILLGRVAYRVIHRGGIEFERLRYNSDELAGLRLKLEGAAVKLKYHPGDLSRLYVFDPFEKRYLEAQAVDQDYTQGLSLWKHQVILNFARQEQQEVDLAALGRARQKIQAIVEAARHRKKTSTRSKIARWDNAGQPPSLAPSQPSVSPTPLLASPSTSGSTSDSAIRATTSTAEGWEMVPGGLGRLQSEPRPGCGVGSTL